MARLQAALDARGREVRELAHMLAAWEALRVGKDAQVRAVNLMLHCRDMFSAVHVLTCDMELPSCTHSPYWKVGGMLVLVTYRVLSQWSHAKLVCAACRWRRCCGAAGRARLPQRNRRPLPRSCAPAWPVRPCRHKRSLQHYVSRIPLHSLM